MPAQADENASDTAADAGERGPPVDMPSQVPDHVGQIHEAINSYLDGNIDDLGAAISDITPDDGDEEESTDEDADEESDESETETEDADDEETSEDSETETSDDETTATPTATATA